MLVPVVTNPALAKDGTTVSIQDTTGTYNISTNPGGYGTPNQSSPPVVIGFVWRYWPDTTPYANVVSKDTAVITALLATGGYAFSTTYLGLGSGLFSSGVHQVKYYPLYRYGSALVTLTQGSKVVTFTSGDTTGLVAALIAVAFSTGGDDSNPTLATNVMYIDTTVATTSTTFSLTTTFTGTTGTYHIWVSTEADLKILVEAPAVNCLVNRIGRISEKQISCSVDYLNDTLKMTMWKFSAEVKFDCKDYEGAHNLIVGIDKLCDPCAVTSPCKTC